ncbi:MAG: hypothetical protein Alis3KO_37970 [Aliiglaciecola sp.]|uniref:hypothetical protein n=1 Tax=Aliiglaciecola sp. M165 TaxID=2593649 RepID=UPI00117C8181|nr:hypothetical protein [Aliiglaciecola sp. M165]TRY29056.1 hypothetical protein FM019_19840 [Aliiglaciecola sp. M165]
MEHPFTHKMELTENTVEKVSAGTVVDIILIECKEGGPVPTKRPPMGTTMAIGEEGGGFCY